MVAKKPRIVIIGAGMAGITAANKLYTSPGFKELFELNIVEGGNRIGGRIHTSEFGGDRIEMGATWIHGIEGSPVHKIAQDINALHSEQPWERMDGSPEDPITVEEGGYELDPSTVELMSNLYKKMMDFAQGKLTEGSESSEEEYYYRIAAKAFKLCTSNGSSSREISVGSFLRQSLETYWASVKGRKEREPINGYGNWTRNSLKEAIFAMQENIERTYTSAGDLLHLDFHAESEYREFPGDQITIPKGYLTIIEFLASLLPADLIQLGRKVTKIEWQPEGLRASAMENGCGSTSRPVKLHFSDGSTMFADHVIVTVSLGVLKAGIQEESGMFSPPLPSFKTEAISRLGFGCVNKLFLQLGPTTHDQETRNFNKFPFLQMLFRRSDSEQRNQKIPWWMRRTASLCPIYENSSVLLSWFAGEEALELESLKDEEIIDGVSSTIASFLPDSQLRKSVNSHKCCNGNGNLSVNVRGCSYGKEGIQFTRALKSQWGFNPLFLGSYSFVAVGSSGDDLDSMAEPLPKSSSNCGFVTSPPPLQIQFAGEATHRTHYSTTHGAYFSGIREAERLLKHYQCGGFSEELHH